MPDPVKPVPMSGDSPISRPSEARGRLLATALRLFYSEGIQSVGVDRLVSEAGVTRATFYRHFRGKDELVVAYVRAKDDELRDQFASASSAMVDATPDDLIRAIAVGITLTVCGVGFRGCPFINAGSEFPDAEHPVRLAIDAHRTWFRTLLRELFDQAGHPEPDHAAAMAVIVRDGAMVSGYLGDPDDAAAALTSGIDQLLREVGHSRAGQ